MIAALWVSLPGQRQRQRGFPCKYWNLLEHTGNWYRRGVTKEMEALERLIDRLSGEVRRAAASGDRDRANGLRAELREARRRWDESLDQLASQAAEPAEDAGLRAAPGRAAALLPAREQVHQALT